MTSIGNPLLLINLLLLIFLLLQSCSCFPPPHPKSQFLSGSRFPSQVDQSENQNQNEDFTGRSSLSQTIQSILNPKFPARNPTTTTTTLSTVQQIVAILENENGNQSLPEISHTTGNETSQVLELSPQNASTSTSTPEPPEELLDENMQRKLYDEELKSVLGNIQYLLPILSRLELNMTDLLAHSPFRENENEEIPEVTRTTSSIPLQILPDFEKPPTIKTQEMSFEFPSPRPESDSDSVAEDNQSSVLLLLRNLYPKKEFSETARILNTLPLKSQEFAYGQLADLIVNSYRNKSGAAELIELACELEGKFGFKKILDRHDIFRNVILPGFFQYPNNNNNNRNKENNNNDNDGPRGNSFYLEARTRSDGPKNLYFDRRNNKIGIMNNDLVPGIFQSWTFLPVRDGCYFVMKSSESDIILGVVVTQSKESPLLAKNVVGVTGLPEGKTNYRFQWKIIPHQVKGKDRTHLLLENRETSLILEWNEFDEVHLSPHQTFDSQQLWIAV